MRAFVAAVMLMACGVVALAQTPPQLQNLPPSRRVTDPARPDFGYTAWLGSEVTVVAVFGADCAPCADSVPFYKRLTTALGTDKSKRRLAILTEGGVFPVIGIIEKHPEGFKTTAASYPQDDRFKLKTLPTLLVFDGAWKQRGRWEGRLTGGQEAEVIKLIETIVAAAAKEKGASR